MFFAYLVSAPLSSPLACYGRGRPLSFLLLPPLLHPETAIFTVIQLFML